MSEIIQWINFQELTLREGPLAKLFFFNFTAAVIFSNPVFIDIINMTALQLALAALLLVSIANGQAGTSLNTAAIPTSVQPINKGLTMQATVWPSY